MAGYEIARVDEIEEIDDGRCPMRPVRHHFGITAFGVNAWTAKNAGDRLINEHDEAGSGDGQEELYVVISGRARFELDGEQRDVPAGAFVFVQPAVKRTAFAEEAGTTIVAIGGAPGKAYVVNGWEVMAPLGPLYEAGDYAAYVAGARKLVETQGGNGGLFYNLACCESLIGETAEALDHLRTAIELRDHFREYARSDSDLDALRSDPAFAALIA